MVHLIDQAASLQRACRVLYMLPLKVSEATFKHGRAGPALKHHASYKACIVKVEPALCLPVSCRQRVN